MAPLRIAHLASHPIQYFAPLYRELSRRSEIDLTVYFYSDATVGRFADPEFGRDVEWDTGLLNGYRHRFSKSARGAALPSGFRSRPNFDLHRQLVTERFDVIWVHGYANPNTWLAAAAAARSRAAFALREEQTLLERRPAHKRLAKRLAVRPLVSRAAGLYIGEENKRWFEHNGVDPDRLFPARYCVDNDFFGAQAAANALDRRAVRASLGIHDDSPVILFSGKLVPKKQPLQLLDAFARLRSKQPAWLLVVGDGELRGEFQARVERDAIQNVVMTGFMPQSKISRAYAAADIFTLPSAHDETWGLVVNEALNFSLPVVVTNKVGCAADLVRDGWNGFVVAPDDTASLSSALERLAASPETRRVFGERGKETVGSYSIPACATDIVGAFLRLRGEAVVATSQASALQAIAGGSGS